MAYYGTLSGANTYFNNRLHSDGWSDSAPADRPKALTEATRIIDSLNFRGVKHSVWLIMYSYNTSTEKWDKILIGPPNRDEMLVADAVQELEHPRGQNSSTPTQIEWATYEFALALLEGFDPEDALERTNVVRQSYASVSTTYADGSQGQEYLVYGIPTGRIWNWLKPYLCENRLIRISRVD